MTVPVKAGEEFQPGSPSKLFTFPDNTLCANMDETPAPPEFSVEGV
jgi:hypothetical protein